LDLDLVNTEADSNASFNKSADYTKLSPLGKVPAFEGDNGFTLSEAIAIAVYGMYRIEKNANSFLPSYDEHTSTSYPWQKYTHTILLRIHQL
jgi:elongation factor 1-gamma